MAALQTLLPELATTPGVYDLAVSGVQDDARLVKKGDLFVAVSGGQYSAQQMLEDIQSEGVAAALYDVSDFVDCTELVNVPLFPIENLDQKRGPIASHFYGDPSVSIFVVAVTGTNGKTSCSQYIASALEEKCGVVGTMGWGVLPELKDPGLTTPAAIPLQEMLHNLVLAGAEAVCLEASSHGLAQYRLDGTSIDTAVFTNLTRDHLDYHGTVEAYQEAKLRLFQFPGLKTAIVNADDAYAASIAESVDSSVQVIRFSLYSDTADVYCRKLQFVAGGINGQVVSPWGEFEFQSSLVGDFNAQNLLTVACVLGSHGFSAAAIGERLSALENVKGRMDRIDVASGAVVVIDYAHTPDALENALKALRGHCEGQLWCVMGCGGDRDVGKRPIMGEIASRLADITIVTDDNPRGEPSDEIIAHIVAGLNAESKVLVESNRKLAIEQALLGAKANDVVLIAGKGHEDYQEIAGVRLSHSDHEEVARVNEKMLQARAGSAEAQRIVILGFGVTGAEVANYFDTLGSDFVIVEDNLHNPKLIDYLASNDSVEVLSSAEFVSRGSDRLMVSPGVPLTHPVVQAAVEQGATLSNDIQLFSEQCHRQLCLVTGSNGKSTVTDYIGQLLGSAGVDTGIGGNIGIPALSLLATSAQAFVLEVSSYQLELATNAKAKVAVLLNLSPDHLDRYDSVADYYRAKQNVFNAAEIAITNRDIQFELEIPSSAMLISFGLDAPDSGHYGVVSEQGVDYLARGNERLVAVSELPITGPHHLLNLLAAIAAAEALGASRNKVLAGLKNLKGLEHRLEIVGDLHDNLRRHLIINDSKSTNPASTAAAVSSVAGAETPIDLILGGETKHADFSVLQGLITNHVDRCVVFGADRGAIVEQITAADNVDRITIRETLHETLQFLELENAEPRTLLFSPGCASFDQFENFEARGNEFKRMMQGGEI